MNRGVFYGAVFVLSLIMVFLIVVDYKSFLLQPVGPTPSNPFPGIEISKQCQPGNVNTPLCKEKSTKNNPVKIKVGTTLGVPTGLDSGSRDALKALIEDYDSTKDEMSAWLSL